MVFLNVHNTVTHLSRPFPLLLQPCVVKEAHNYLLNIVTSCFQNIDDQSESDQWQLLNESSINTIRSGATQCSSSQLVKSTVAMRGHVINKKHWSNLTWAK